MDINSQGPEDRQEIALTVRLGYEGTSIEADYRGPEDRHFWLASAESHI
jgi:hypothetical protein